jgi:GR25 family glycosyltransferase involved in LPS biosynthesis
MPIQVKTPILFLIFNRPDTTAKVFERIREIKPKKLFVSADGPRANKHGEAERCEETRRIIDGVDWECEVHRNFSSENLGCKRGVVKGITWFFENVEEGIIIEDDCILEDSFFTFTEEMLERYRNDQRIMHIGAANFQDGKVRGDASYYFSKLCHVWGWATWRRAWKNYDVQIKSFEKFKAENGIAKILKDEKMQAHWMKLFQTVYDNALDTWDFQWVYTVWEQGGMSVIPNVNFVSNIGFGEDATHTMDSAHVLAENKTGKLGEIIHPEKMEPDEEADLYTFYHKIYQSKWSKVKTKVLSKFKKT